MTKPAWNRRIDRSHGRAGSSSREAKRTEIDPALGDVPGGVLLVLGAATVFGLAFMPVSGFITVLLPLGVGTVGWWRARNARVAA